MLIKKKSLIVAVVSSIVISLVLVVNLTGYMIYLQLKDDELSKRYLTDLSKVSADVYAKFIEIAKLEASFDPSGPLSGKAVLEGIIRNDGHRDISDLCIRVKFLDADGAAIYDVTFEPLEPSLGSCGAVAQASISRLIVMPAYTIKPENSFPFKKILVNCPKEILSELKPSARSPGRKGKWSGRLSYDILSVRF